MLTPAAQNSISLIHSGNVPYVLSLLIHGFAFEFDISIGDVRHSSGNSMTSVVKRGLIRTAVTVILMVMETF